MSPLVLVGLLTLYSSISLDKLEKCSVYLAPFSRSFGTHALKRQLSVIIQRLYNKSYFEWITDCARRSPSFKSLVQILQSTWMWVYPPRHPDQRFLWGYVHNGHVRIWHFSFRMAETSISKTNTVESSMESPRVNFVRWKCPGFFKTLAKFQYVTQSI